MDAVAILFYGNKTLLDCLDKTPASLWLTGGACGVWSIKDIVAHLASYEHMLFDVLNAQVNGADMPFLQRFGSLGEGVNDVLVGETAAHSSEQVLNDYKALHERVMALAKQMPADLWAKNGTIPWYGEGYSLDDFIVYTQYGHKREHSGQIDIFRDSHAS